MISEEKKIFIACTALQSLGARVIAVTPHLCLLPSWQRQKDVLPRLAQELQHPVKGKWERALAGAHYLQLCRNQLSLRGTELPPAHPSSPQQDLHSWCPHQSCQKITSS